MSEASFDQLWINARLATMVSGPAPYGSVEQAAIGLSGDRIAWVGPMAELPKPAASLSPVVHNAEGRWITPGLIDCHTHLVYGGDRAAEFELRLKGATYEEISRAGGGIVSTVKATREADDATLVKDALPRLDALMAEGVTTIEIKSGYGLSLEEESKMLRAARKLAELRPIGVKTSFLGAHALPPEFAGRQSDYIEAVVAMIRSSVTAATTASTETVAVIRSLETAAATTLQDGPAMISSSAAWAATGFRAASADRAATPSTAALAMTFSRSVAKPTSRAAITTSVARAPIPW